MSDEKSADGSSRPASFTNEKEVKNGSDSVEHITADLRTLDVGLSLVAGHTDEPEISPQESKRLRRKIDRHLLPLLCFIYTGEWCRHMFTGDSVDKCGNSTVHRQVGCVFKATLHDSHAFVFVRGTLSSSSILGILTDANLSTKDFNNLSSAFYIGRSPIF